MHTRVQERHLRTRSGATHLEALLSCSPTGSLLEGGGASCYLIDQPINHVLLLSGQDELRVANAAFDAVRPAALARVPLRIGKLLRGPTFAPGWVVTVCL